MASEIRFEWDIQKAASNFQKHKVRFELAALTFGDPFVYEFEDGNEHGEARYRAIGEALGKLLFVSYTSFEEDGEEVVRIISARKVTPRERRAYEREA